MAAPAEKTIKDLNGVWVMNKTLSDDIDEILQIQNIGWFLRKAISLATVTLTVSQYDDDDSITHIDIQQVATGNISRTEELRKLDWEYRDHSDKIFGNVKGRSRWVKVEDLEGEAFLKEGWDETGVKVQTFVSSDENSWTAEQVWGFEVFNEKRYHCRHVIVRSTKDDDKWKMARLVYDYKGAE